MTLLEAMETKKPFTAIDRSIEEFLFDGKTLRYRFSDNQSWKIVTVVMVSQLGQEYKLV